MKNLNDPFNILIHGYGKVEWGAKFEDLAPLVPARNVSICRSQSDTPPTGTGWESKPSGIITIEGPICAAEAMIGLYFDHGQLRSMAYYFPHVARLESEEFYALVDCIKRRLTDRLCEPVSVTAASGDVELAFRWTADDYHADVRAHAGEVNEIRVIAHDPAFCSCGSSLEEYTVESLHC